MKIYSDNNINKIKTYASEVKSKRSSKITSNNEDEILLSERAVQFARFKERLSALPDVRHEIVAKIKSLIQNGSYHIDSEKIADKLIEESLHEK